MVTVLTVELHALHQSATVLATAYCLDISCTDSIYSSHFQICIHSHHKHLADINCETDFGCIHIGCK